jgi:hypothetical protein
MSECKRTHVTGTEYKTMLMGKDSDGKDMMQKDPVAQEAGQIRTWMGKDPDGKDTDLDFGRFESEHLNLKYKPFYSSISFSIRNFFHSHIFFIYSKLFMAINCIVLKFIIS